MCLLMFKGKQPFLERRPQKKYTTCEPFMEDPFVGFLGNFLACPNKTRGPIQGPVVTRRVGVGLRILWSLRVNACSLRKKTKSQSLVRPAGRRPEPSPKSALLGGGGGLGVWGWGGALLARHSGPDHALNAGDGSYLVKRRRGEEEKRKKGEEEKGKREKEVKRRRGRE